MSDTLKDIQPKLKALGIYQIIGGIIGICLTLWMINLSSKPALLVLIILFALSLFAYSIYCGVLILRKPEQGLKHSKINQFLQVVSFFMFGYAFQYASGIYLSFGLDLTESLNFKFNAGVSSWQINVNSSNPAFVLNLNLVALFLVILIDKLQKKIRVEDQLLTLELEEPYNKVN